MSAPAIRVLLVEDDDDHVELIGALLRRATLDFAGFDRLSTLADARRALTTGNYDVTLLDLDLPDSAIAQTLKELPTLRASCPIIVLTSLDDPEMGKLAVQQGAQDYLSKLGLSLRRISDSVRYAIERDGLTKRLEAAQRAAERAAAAKAQFLATMSHEIRTPMNAVIGFTNLLLESGPTEDQRRWLNVIQSSGEALLVLINDILDLSQIEAGKLRVELAAVCPRTAIADVITLLDKSATDKGLDVKVEVAADVPSAVMGDASRVRQILVNLVGNAIKFTSIGWVQVVLRIEKRGEDQWLAFSVMDSGPGIPEEQLPFIFEAFTQGDSSTSRRFGGSGLGLAITRRLVDVLGGTIYAENNSGGGAKFTVHLPCVKSDAVSVRGHDARAAGQSEPGLAGLRILVAEDTPTNQLLVRRVLELMGCVVDIVASGQEALENLEHLEYDAVLMDCHMPEMDGYQATRAIRALEQQKTSRRIPIVALTAGAFDEDRQACLAAGMDDFLTKPLREVDLRQALTRWSARERL